VKVAAANWVLRRVASVRDFEEHLLEIVDQAVGVDWLILPELLILELAPLLGAEVAEPDLARALAGFGDEYEALLVRLAKDHAIGIIGGSHFARSGDRIVNLCAVVDPTGTVWRQRKNRLTRYERDVWHLEAGGGLTAMPPELGVLVCYDSEFPEAARAQAERGSRVLAVPAFTETRRGFQRVRWCCLARAVENQMFVVHASLTGSLGGEPVPQAVGSSAVIAPSTEPFPEAAILAETGWNQEGLAIATLDFDALELSRMEGSVRPWTERHDGVWV